MSFQRAMHFGFRQAAGGRDWKDGIYFPSIHRFGTVVPNRNRIKELSYSSMTSASRLLAKSVTEFSNFLVSS